MSNSKRLMPKSWVKYLVKVDNKEHEAWFVNGKYVLEIGLYLPEEVEVIKKLKALK